VERDATSMWATNRLILCSRPTTRAGFVCVSGLSQVKVYKLNLAYFFPPVNSDSRKQAKSFDARCERPAESSSLFSNRVIKLRSFRRIPSPTMGSPPAVRQCPIVCRPAPDVGLIAKWNGGSGPRARRRKMDAVHPLHACGRRSRGARCKRRKRCLEQGSSRHRNAHWQFDL